MILGIGTDIVMVSRIQRSLDRFGEKFAKRILHEAELTDWQNAKSPAHFLAKRFAAKEAVAKALGSGMRKGVTFRSIAVGHNASGKPEINVSNGAAKHATGLGVTRWHISLSDEQDHALAFVIVEG